MASRNENKREDFKESREDAREIRPGHKDLSSVGKRAEQAHIGSVEDIAGHQ